MSEIKISELFYSIQGEGRYMGVPSVFLRTFGCNFTCDGFGMPKGKKSNERHIIAKNIKVKTYKELPLVSTGCDSYASWDPKFKNLSPKIPIDSIVKSIVDLLPNKCWHDEHLVITGGEPLLGWQKQFPALLDHPLMQDLKELTFETNGTQKLTPQFKSFLDSWSLGRSSAMPRGRDKLTFSVSPKLSISGEKREDAIKREVVCEYEEVGYTYLKFVIASKEDADEALRVIDMYRNEGFKGPIYFMPLGGIESIYSMNNRTVAQLALDNGLRYSDRLQVPLFKNEWGT